MRSRGRPARPYLRTMGTMCSTGQPSSTYCLPPAMPPPTDFGKEIIPLALERWRTTSRVISSTLTGKTLDHRCVYEANLALHDQPRPAFSFYDEKIPIYHQAA